MATMESRGEENSTMLAIGINEEANQIAMEFTKDTTVNKYQSRAKATAKMGISLSENGDVLKLTVDIPDEIKHSIGHCITSARVALEHEASLQTIAVPQLYKIISEVSRSI